VLLETFVITVPDFLTKKISMAISRGESSGASNCYCSIFSLSDKFVIVVIII